MFKGFCFIVSWVFELAFAFRAEICLNPIKWVFAMAFRGVIVCLFYFNADQFFKIFEVDRTETVSAALYNVFFILPVCLFVLWYIVTTLLMFLGMLYYGRLSGDSHEQSNNKDGLIRLLDWRNNKMRFMSYRDGSQLMRDTALLNNLSESDPEARRQLDYINCKLSTMGYTEALEFLCGNK